MEIYNAFKCNHKGENMKITKLSLAAIAAMTITTGAMADVDFKIGGQAVLYYQTAESGGDTALFNQDDSAATVGLQLNLNSDLGNGFGLGMQGSALGTLGLEKHVVSNIMQSATGDLNGAALTKAYLTKKIGNTTLKAGRQELPKSLSPLAFSEGWNVFKNTFDAVVAINSDIPDTTVVGAYVSKSNSHGAFGKKSSDGLSSFTDLAANGSVPINGGAYMLTVANKSSKIVQPTISYYAVKDINGGESGSAIWADIKVAAADLPVKLALQGGQIDPSNNLDKTTVYGAKVTGKAGPAVLKLAYSSVDDGTVSVQNVGTGVKTPLYTQMVANQGHISTDSDTVVLQAAMPVGPGKLIAQYGLTTDNSGNNSDFNELDVIYKFKALGTNMLAAYVMADHEAAADPVNIIRVWSRYNF